MDPQTTSAQTTADIIAATEPLCAAVIALSRKYQLPPAVALDAVRLAADILPLPREPHEENARLQRTIEAATAATRKGRK